MNDKRFMTAKEAAEALAISIPTLYAYVSRGLVRSEPGTGKSRARRYHGEDVNALLARKEQRRNPAKVAETALHFGQPVLESAITLIENGRLYYRGHDVISLPTQHSFEAVASLIWQSEFGNDDLFTTPLPDPLWQQIQRIAPFLRDLSPVEAFQVVLPLVAAYDLAAYDLRKTAVIQTGVRLIKLLTTVITGQQTTANIAQTLQQAWVPHDEQAAALINMALIYCADHELNVSAFTARTVASAEATPYSAVIAGLAALRGRLHGGATEQVDAFFNEVRQPKNARQAVANRLKRGERIPGFGHPLYPDGDPRGRALLDAVTAVYPKSEAVEMVVEVETAVAGTIGYQPNIDTALTTLVRAAQLPPGAPLTLFALGRTVGWIGQTLEQYRNNQLIRPRAKYVGDRPISSS
ncbi:MAG: helix-turn-helix domain-containing protein [Chloroflexi bacterium]|nr:MAG: helix-turn-helix domain-containing protein [Chloroflexota bacterium]